MYFKYLNAPRLCEIAEAFFSHYQIFGRLLLDGKIKESFIAREDISEHLKELSSFLYFLERVVELGFDDKEIPLLYNTRSWSPDLDVGGFNSARDDLSFEQILQSYYSAWILQSGDKEGRHNRFFKAVLWVYQKKGFSEAVLYTIHLQKSGHIIDSELTGFILYNLFHAYQISKDDSEILNYFFQEQPLETQTEWFDAVVSWEFNENAEILREIPERVILTLVTAGLDECEELRNAKSYNDFFIIQKNLTVSLDLIYDIIKSFVEDKSVFLIGILDQFEEIGADFSSIRLWEREYSFRWSMAETMLKMNQFHGEEFIYRLIEERALIPYELTSHAIKYRSFENLPDYWRELSAPVSAKYIVTAFKKDYRTIWRKSFLTSQDVANDIFEAVLNKYEIHNHSGNTDMNFDKDFFISAINLESVPVIEGVKNGFVMRSKTLKGETSEFKAKYKKWRKYILPKIKSKIDEIYSIFCLEDFLNRMRNTWNSDDDTELEEKLQIMYDLYPSYSQSLAELAIFYDDRKKDPTKAFDYLKKALVLDPLNPLLWQSMGVLLKNLDDKNSSDVAFMYKDLLDQLNSNSDLDKKSQ